MRHSPFPLRPQRSLAGRSARVVQLPKPSGRRAAAGAGAMPSVGHAVRYKIGVKCAKCTFMIEAPVLTSKGTTMREFIRSVRTRAALALAAAGLGAAALLAACGGGGGSDSGTLQLSLTD